MSDLLFAARRVPPWAVYLALGAVALGIHANLETGSLTQSFVYDVIGASAVGVILIGVWVHKPQPALPWLLIAAGQASFVAGDLVWNWHEIIGEEPFPSFADVLYLAGYPVIAAGLFLMIRHRVADGDRGGLLDAAILTTAAAILSWTFLMRPQVVGVEIDPLSLAISLAYPLGDVLLIGVAMGLITTPGARTTAFKLLMASLGVLLVADQIYALQVVAETYVSGGPIDSLYLVAYLLIGAAAAHPSMERLTEPHPVAVTWLGPVRMLALAVAMVTGPLLVAIGPEADGGLIVTALGTALLSILVLVRLAGVVGLLERDVTQRRALEARLRHQANHDPLTGLANRRRFVAETEAALAARAVPGSIAALFLDLDDFKTVNDSLGHKAGDDLLIAVAARLRADLRDEDVAARLGGDEFGILLVGIPDAGYAATVADRLLAALDVPIGIAGRIVSVGASIGIAIDTAAVQGVDDLLGAADIAMYGAKASGKGRYQVSVASPTGATEPASAAGAPMPTTVRRPAIASPYLRPEAG